MKIFQKTLILAFEANSALSRKIETKTVKSHIVHSEEKKLHFIHFILQVRWGDSYDGYGEHYWEYNHGPSYEEPAAYVEPAKPYSPPAYVN